MPYKTSDPMYELYMEALEFDNVSKSDRKVGGGGSRTPVLSVHPSASTGLDLAENLNFHRQSISPVKIQDVNVSITYNRQR